MGERNDGGPAFPRPSSRNFPEGDPAWDQTGMTLRDWFAGRALIVMLRSWDGVPGTETGGGMFAKWSEAAYGVADAMLAERGRQ